MKKREPERGGIVALLTDFGTEDAYAGVMKAVIHSVNPRVQIFDLTHGVPRQDIRAASFHLLSAYPFLPSGCVTASVVDPGVGSRRKILCARVGGRFFLAPDNGLLSPLLSREKRREIREVSNTRFFLPRVSRTFQGRDIFAPVAARLAADPGIFKNLGPVLRAFAKMPWPQPRAAGRQIRGEVIHADIYGNLITNLPHNAPKRVRGRASLQIGRRTLRKFAGSYSEGGRGEALIVVNSAGLLEIAVNGGSAEKLLGVSRGDPAVLQG